MRLLVYPGKEVQFHLNDQLVFNSKDPRLTGPEFAMDALTVGSGFSRQRHFSGDIENFQLSIETWRRRSTLTQMAVLAVAAFALTWSVVLTHKIRLYSPLVAWLSAAAVLILGLITPAVLPGGQSQATWLLLIPCILIAAIIALDRPSRRPLRESMADGKWFGLIAGGLTGGIGLAAWCDNPACSRFTFACNALALSAAVVSLTPGLPPRLRLTAALLTGLGLALIGHLIAPSLAGSGPITSARPLLLIAGIASLLSLTLPRLVWLICVLTKHPPRSFNSALIWAGPAGMCILYYAKSKSSLFPASPLIYLYECLGAIAAILLLRLAGELTHRLHRWLNHAVAALAGVTIYLYFSFLSLLGTYRTRVVGTGGRSDTLFNFDEIGAIIQSNAGEAIGYLTSSFTHMDLLACLLLPLLAAFVAIYTVWQASPSTRSQFRTWGLTLAGLSIFLCLIPNRTPSLASLIESDWQRFRARAQEFSAYVQKREKFPIGGLAASKSAQGETYVLVIGESANPQHMSAYGYGRATTPWLDAQAKQPGWLFFQNAYASYSHTVPSLLMALTSANQYNGAQNLEAPTLIDVFKAAGFKTYWLSEQGLSWTDSPLNAIATRADKCQFVRPLGRMPALLEKTLATIDPAGNNLIVLHLIGSHAPYSSRIPAGYSPAFLANDAGMLAYLDRSRPGFIQDVLNPYDASIHYTDQTLSDIRHMLQSRVGEVSAFIYCSDHGEDVFGGKGHNSTLFTFPMVRIPLVIALSESWQERYPEKFALLQSRRDHIFTLDLLFELMTGLSDIQTPLRESRFDLTAGDYGLTTANALTMMQSATLQRQFYPEVRPKHVVEDPLYVAKQSMLFLNTRYGTKFIRNYADAFLAPAESLQVGFTGVEINVAIPDMTVGHYPSVLSDYALADWLRVNPPEKFRKLWLDLKLVTGHGLAEGLPALDRLDQKYTIKDRSIIESWDPGLEHFSDRGWATSYYLYEGNWPALNSHDPGELKVLAEALAKTIQARRARAVSFHAKHYDFVKTYLEPLLPAATDYHTWALDLPALSAHDFIEKIKSHPIVSDPRIATILIDQPADQ